MSIDPGSVEEAARLLREAHDDRRPCEPVHTLLPAGSVEAAYAVQRLNTQLGVAAGRRIVGWKTGLTSRAVQEQFGVGQPDFGVLFADTCYGDAQPVPLSRLLQPRVEAEVAFVLGRDLPTSQVTPADVVRATAFVLPSIEIVDSRIDGWKIDIVDTIADNASSGLFVLGGRPVALGAVDLHDVTMELRRGDEVVSSGTGAACLAHPVNAVVWLANTLASVGTPLRAGDTVLSGSLGPTVPVTSPATFVAAFDGLGAVRAEFVAS
jgi:2-keto-4-pentenoate hydratase